MSTKEAYKQKVQADVELAQAKLAQLKAEAKSAAADAGIKYEKQMGELEKGVEDTKAKLKELADASDDTWESFKDGVENAWDKLSSAVEDTTDKVKDKFKS